ncbi:MULTISPECIES: DUF2513 domain-containing protein [unclassified Afipia]|uniref:DUF2513 domain-containing protein n=1 Tax=unclassified Afipia TaxID=2642050 RepID=UPI0004B830B3|nr:MULTISPECIES: DUF2513 domain-containing protein [unclassified Afipia]
MDLIREILLAVERLDIGKGEDVDVAIDDIEPHILAAHVRLLSEAGFLDAHEIPDNVEEYSHFIPTRLTWSGYEFLDLVRDPEVWRRTKAGAAKAGGAGMEFMWELAKAYGKQLMKEKIGIDL